MVLHQSVIQLHKHLINQKRKKNKYKSTIVISELVNIFNHIIITHVVSKLVYMFGNLPTHCIRLCIVNVCRSLEFSVNTFAYNNIFNRLYVSLC